MTDPSPAPRTSVSIPALDTRYVIREELGRGGKSTVYLADDRLLTRQVAIKVFRSRAESAEALREQEAEAKLIASMNHYALTTLFDAGVDTSDPERPQIYLVMEHVAGSDLKQRLRSGPLDWFQVCWLGRDLAEGLEYLHASGFLHRDIKPANVLLAAREQDVRLRAKLADFGIASLVGTRDAGAEVTGTAAYLSPEQVEGHPPTPASDVYAFGLVLLEALTGRVAFPGGLEDSAFARLDHDPQIDVPADVPEAIRSVLRGMTSRDPAARPALPEVAAVFQNQLIDDLVRQRGYSPTPPEEQERVRLAAVERYEILGTPSEEAFDRITRLGARLLRVPVCVISVIDTDRVWLKSRVGMGEPEVARNVSFCATTRTGAGAWAIPDTLDDPQAATNPLVTGPPYLRAFAAAPLITHDGHMLGALCASDVVPRDFDAEDLLTLTELAAIVMHEIELRLASRRAIFDR